ncbi:MAG: response regulator transcription factor [Clostridia bacterium]|nr:response regulator transcription factor [Clostridia bacterium]
MRILLIEDQRTLREPLEAILRKNNYDVDSFEDGINGQEAAETGIYDVIVLDLMLPGKSGFDVLKELREGGIITPVIVLTAKTSLKDKVNAFELGADDYLTKPFQATELLLRIKAISRRKGEIEDTSIVYGDLSLDTENCLLTCKTTGKSIQISAKEYQMMEYMMKRGGKKITKEDFLDKIWGVTSDAEYNSVEVYISFLRKKLRFLGTEASIKAIRGVGYKLAANDDE